MQLYSSVLTHYPGPVFTSPSSASGDRTPTAQPPANMPAFSSCFELLPHDGTGGFTSSARISVRPVERIVPIRIITEPMAQAAIAVGESPSLDGRYLDTRGAEAARNAAWLTDLSQQHVTEEEAMEEPELPTHRPAQADHVLDMDLQAGQETRELEPQGFCRRQECDPEVAPEPRGGTSEASQKHALYLAELEQQDSYLQHKGRYRFNIIPDGNCLYRAISKAMFGEQSKHKQLREQTVYHVADHLEEFNPLIEGDAGHFLIGAAQDGAWAGYPELLAMSQMLNVNIYLTTGGRPECPTVSTMVHYLGPDDPSRPSIWLSWLSNGHYDAVFDCPLPNPEYENWRKQTQVQRQRDEDLAKSMAISLSKMYIEQNAAACS
ncbi:OTU domain-containing protein 1 [Ambystoma mexicanum]|uniref:OTU domain-containing protein 1 n=1 Tax=Ambystoma mexicanum TaxID=8296 RepID=UPI0037E884E1